MWIFYVRGHSMSIWTQTSVPPSHIFHSASVNLVKSSNLVSNPTENGVIIKFNQEFK